MSQSDAVQLPAKTWWKEAVVYQIYPRSFNDSDGDVRQTDGLTSQPESRQLSGDGIGDIPGITEKVDYLDALGVDVVWLCPVYDSPNEDNGYDIRDYRAIMDEFGTMADWETLLSELHARDMRLIMDLVVNHTSREHEWFQRSRRREGAYEDYYYWRDGSPDEPPNNWESIFGGPAWTYDDEREQWYLHLFDENQPDLNWRNPAVREDIKEMITWWLEKGIDGFRMDAINFLSKAEGLPDGDPDAALVGHEHYAHGPRIHDYLQDVYDDTLANYDAMTVGEMGGTSIDEAADYLVEGGSGLDMIFQFTHLDVDVDEDDPWNPEVVGEWDLTEFKEIVTRAQNELAGEFWDALFLGNHDLPRIVSRFGDGAEQSSAANQTSSGDDEAYHEESAKLIATFLLTLRGTPYVYQGDEIGMTNAEFDSLEELDDVMTIGNVEALIESGEIESFDEVRDVVNYQSRDHARTPMQWSDASNAGFTDGEPWFRVNENSRDINVEAALAAEHSIWHHYQSLIDLRHELDTLVYGTYELLLPDHDQLFAYVRTLDEEELLVVLNWSDDDATFDAPGVETADAERVLSNYDESPDDPSGSAFRPYEAVVYRL